VTQESGDKTLEVWAVSDIETVEGSFTLTGYTYNQTDDQGKVLASNSSFSVEGGSSLLGFNLTLEDLTQHFDLQDGFFVAELKTADSTFREVIHGSYLVNSSISIKPNLTVEQTAEPTLETLHDGLTVYTSNYTVSNAKGSVAAFFVTLETEGAIGYFRDNVFLLLPGESREVTWVYKQGKDPMQVWARSYV